MRRELLIATTALLLAGCRSGSDAPAPTGAPPSDGTEVAAAASAFAGSEACADCHAEEAKAHASSPHALDMQLVESELPHADSGAPIDDPSVLVTHRLGTRRLVSWLGAHEGELQVLPRAWSVTRGEWVDHREDGDEAWTSEIASWRLQCADCHVDPSSAAGEQVALAPEEARSLGPGISCEHCHGAGARHAELARERPDDAEAIRASIVRAGRGAWQGCAHCHADGSPQPLRAGPALRAGDPLSDHRLAHRAVDPLRPDLRFFADGRPGQAHGLTVQSFAQSACFLEGEATCLGCHDPHGGGLKEADPDAGCRTCHAGIAADAAAHAKHPVAAEPVPLASDEPGGPDPARAPGCVDCHAPAILPFGPSERLRDHAFGRPEPELMRDFGMPGACSSCHADEDPQVLADWLNERFPDRVLERHPRAAAFRRALGLAMVGETTLATDAVEPLAALVEDGSQDPWLRASAASALGRLGAAAAEAGPALVAVLESPSPELAIAAAEALGKTGTDEMAKLSRIVREHPDWRLRLVLAVSLDKLGESSGSAELQLLASDPSLPRSARARGKLQLGLALLRRGLLERAVFQLEDAIEEDDSSVPAWLNLGVARAGIDDVDGARLAWLTVLDLEPGNAAARANLLRLDHAGTRSAP